MPGTLLLLLATALAGEPDGKAVSLAQACHRCHAVPVAEIAKLGDDTVAGPDLAGLAARHDAAWLRTWLVRQNEQHDNPHLESFEGSEAEMTALVEWLLEQ